MAEQKTDQHKSDMYGDLNAKASSEPAVPAATVVILRDAEPGHEVLMLRKNSKIAFGGMWVFPGGRIDEEDYPEDRHLETAARIAAARETREEAGVVAAPDDFVWFAHWTPPPTTPKRFATWFFVTHTDADHIIEIDGGEIEEHSWIAPAEALEKHRAGDIDLAPPTWLTLYHLSRRSPAAAVVEHFRAEEAKVYETHVGVRADGVRVAMWHGDAGYEDTNADAEGHRHRLVMHPGGFDFENTVETY